MDYHPHERAGLSPNIQPWEGSTGPLSSASVAGATLNSNLLAGMATSEEDEDFSGRSVASADVAARRTAARTRQVDIGKARPEYERYLASIPKERRTPTRPRTPDPAAPLSKRQFDRQLSEWRRLLHEYDDPSDPPDTSGSPTTATASSAHALASSSASTLLPDYEQVSQAVPAWPSSSLSSRNSEAPPLGPRAVQNYNTANNGVGLSERSYPSADRRYDRHNASLEPLRAPLPVVQGYENRGFYDGVIDWAGAEQSLRTIVPQHNQHLFLNSESSYKAVGSPTSRGLGLTADAPETSTNPQVGFGSANRMSQQLLKDIPMKVYIPLDGAPQYVGRGGIECAQDVNGHHENDSSEGCPVT
jgi:hypothetical protein|mmetsp:Transcript_85811/g.135527  ORF Transcript_85811/g.135527 Transcript_85811/m.135527 type:complete len:360 (-) Transcript_85811:115-1194(-)